MNLINRSAILLRPKEPYINWAANLDDHSPAAAQALRDQTSIYLVNEIHYNTDENRAIKRHFEEVFESELNAWHRDPAAWPENRSLKMFRDWFDVEVQSMVIELADTALEVELM